MTLGMMLLIFLLYWIGFISGAFYGCNMSYSDEQVRDRIDLAIKTTTEHFNREIENLQNCHVSEVNRLNDRYNVLRSKIMELMR